MRKYDILKFHISSENNYWPVLMSIQMSELMMSFPHIFFAHFIYRKRQKNLIFWYDNVNLTFVRVWHDHFTQINIHKDWSRSVSRKYRQFQNFITAIFDFHDFCTMDFVGTIFLFCEIMNILAQISSLRYWM